MQSRKLSKRLLLAVIITASGFNLRSFSDTGPEGSIIFLLGVIV